MVLSDTPICIARKAPDEKVSFETVSIQEYPLKWNKNIITYAVLKGSTHIPNNHEIVIAVNAALSTWGAEIPVKFVRVFTNNADITYEWIPGSTDPVIKGDTSILGYSGFPDVSGTPIHVKFNDDVLWSFSGTNFQFNPNNTILHETGHCLGLVHSPDCSKCIMNTFYNGVIDLDPVDIQRITAKYGKRTISNTIYLGLKSALHRIKTSLK